VETKITTQTNLDKRHLPFGNSAACQDPNTLNLLNTFTIADKLSKDAGIFCQTYLSWIKSSTNNTFTNLEAFGVASYSNGTTEAFDKFYMKNHTRRFRCFKGEYMYHQLAWRNSWPDWKFLEDAGLDANDAVVISLPFSDTGNEHASMKQVLSACEQLNIPVLVDCAYFGICSNIHFNFSYTCITDITFSLSKQFPVAHARIGMRLTKDDDDDSLFVCNKNGYVNRIGAALGLHCISEFGPDYTVNKYKQQQLKYCEILGVQVSNTVLFGIGGIEWIEYNRGTDTNRLSFHKYLHLTEHDLPNSSR
jgi:hypothetical protein